MSEKVFSLDTLDHFIQGLMGAVEPSISAEDKEAFSAFARLFFHRYSFADIEGRRWRDIAAWALFLWEYQRREQKWPAVDLWLRDDDELEWQRPHTLLLIHQRDMPFLVDSVRIELVRRNIPIYSMKTMPYELDDQGCVKPIDQARGQARALIYLEIGYQSNGEDSQTLKNALREVLAQVEKIVGDHQALRRATFDLADNIQQTSTQDVDTRTAETHAFLQWLLDDHFTFLGYSEFDLQDRHGKQTLVENRHKRLGLFDNQTATRTKVVTDKSGIANFYASEELVAFSKSPERSRVHRNAYPDYVVVKRFNGEGQVIGEARLLGLYTSSVYSVSPMNIPLVREKLRHLYTHMGLHFGSHEGKALAQIIDTFPRDELFQFAADELQQTLAGILSINERYQVRLFLRRDPFGKFVSALVYIPRDIFSTQVREHIQRFLSRYLGAVDDEFNTWFSESVLARVHLVFRIKSSRAQPTDETRRVEEKIADLIKPWRHKLYDKLINARGEQRGRQAYQIYGRAFSGAYEEFYHPSQALEDIAQLEAMGERDITLTITTPSRGDINIKLYARDSAISLSDVIPVMENMGLRVIAEHPFVVSPRDAASVWLHDFQLQSPGVEQLEPGLADKMRDLFTAVWQGRVVNDGFNRLVMMADIDWQEVQMLRSYAGYLRQIVFPFATDFIADVLCKHPGITRLLVAYFCRRFDPEESAGKAREESLQSYKGEIEEALEAVENLNEDRILRQCLALMQATVRCNYYQRDHADDFPPYLSFKLMPRQLEDVPAPRPLYEIYVNSQRVEGVHLRSSSVARGGLRWSDRLQDYRTEILGLVKAQQVKNAVIVPSGAKGGFVCKRAEGLEGQALRDEGLACYRLFISALLDITDNLHEGEIIPPPQVVRYDDDDPYLVVAADKGTASFSDEANAIAADYDFWLDDAFASGGSQGYDHKAMGITARGAWVSVWRHFMERGHDVNHTPFTVLGIGDMGGDVFGNGMLLSRQIKLVAAFNHKHIFIDPDPDCEASWQERQRLFNSDRSGWDSYDTSLISEGGGVFSRGAKSIALTPQIREALDIEAEHLTPTALIHHLLQAPVDLIWNGGIGTYVKSSDESHQAVGDKANDNLRVDGSQLRCRVFGEGGNLGMTQRGRIEFAMAGGACNTDFIDNSAGVDCSDHEVNIKILLHDRIKAGQLDRDERNQLLRDMTEDVAELVLDNNYQQTLAISLAQQDQSTSAAEFRRFIQSLEAAGRLNRQLEALPDDETLNERSDESCPLTRPELAVLIAYAKMTLKEQLVVPEITADSALAAYCRRAFPPQLHERFPEAWQSHRLQREIAATELANAMVNQLGCTFAQRMNDATGADALAIARAYLYASHFFQAQPHRQALEALDFTLAPAVQLELINILAARVRRGVRWFLRNYRQQGDKLNELDAPPHTAEAIQDVLLDSMNTAARDTYREEMNASQYSEVPEELLTAIVPPGPLYTGLAVADICRDQRFSLTRVGQVYVALLEFLQLDVFARHLSRARSESYWQFLARESFMDDLEAQAKVLTQSLLEADSDETSAEALVEQWAGRHEALIKRWQTMVSAIHGGTQVDYAMFAVGLRELLDMVQATRYTQK